MYWTTVVTDTEDIPLTSRSWHLWLLDWTPPLRLSGYVTGVRHWSGVCLDVEPRAVGRVTTQTCRRNVILTNRSLIRWQLWYCPWLWSLVIVKDKISVLVHVLGLEGQVVGPDLALMILVISPVLGPEGLVLGPDLGIDGQVLGLVLGWGLCAC